MPACFQLYKKGSLEPECFVDVDNEICAMFDIPVHPVKYAFGWYDLIGFWIAVGKTYDEMRTILAEPGWNYVPELLRIIDWFEKDFENTHWTEIGRRR